MKTVFPETIFGSSLARTPPVAWLRDAAAAVDALFAPILGQFFTWLQRARDRRALQRLDDHMLHDIGLSFADVEREASKPFWRS
jgi:uncharacterized protein YjiS (DUF1127 family)